MLDGIRRHLEEDSSDPNRSPRRIANSFTAADDGDGRASFVAAVVLLVPDYAKSGRLSSILWHRVVISLPLNPAWPFGDVAQMYDCRRYIPPGMQGIGYRDQVGHCIWVDYAIRHDIPEREINTGIYGSHYEAVMREAFIDIARRYPGEVLKTFFYYKPRLILSSLGLVLRTNMSVFPPLAIGLLVAALGNLLVCLVGPTAVLAAGRRRAIVAATLLFTASTIPPFLVAWATPETIADLAFFSIFCAGLALGGLCWGTGSVLRQPVFDNEALQATVQKKRGEMK